MKTILAMLTGLGIGAFLMYLFDPEGGNRRRALIRDKGVSLSHKTQRAVSGKVTDLTNRSKGMLHEAKKAFETGREEARPESPGQNIVH
jgi:hypothetical protein